jgi:hypothetical protein
LNDGQSAETDFVQSYVDVQLCAEKGKLNNISLVVSG